MPGPSLKRVNGDDFSDAPDWFRRFLDTLNPFLGDTTDGFAAGNYKRQVEKFVLTTGPTVSSAFTSGSILVKNKLRTKPTEVRVGQLFNRGAGGVIEDAWHTVTSFTNSWAQYGDFTYGTIGYYKDALGTVHLRGLLASGTLNTAAFTLPAGYRPEYGQIYGTVAGGAFAELRVYNDGTVVPVSGSTAWFSLFGVTFRADTSVSTSAVNWELLQNGLIRINYISGLVPSTTYDVTLIVE